MSLPDPVKPGDPFTAAWLEALRQYGKDKSAITAVAPLMFDRVGTVSTLRMALKTWRPIELQADLGLGRYTAREVVPAAAGAWTPLAGGWTGDAYEFNKLTGLAVAGKKYWPAQLGHSTEARFYAYCLCECPHTACLRVRHLDDDTPYAGLTVRAQTGGPPVTFATGTTDGDGLFCFAFTPGGTGYRCEIDVPTGHGTTMTLVALNVVPSGGNLCSYLKCVAVCAGRFVLNVQSADGDVGGLTQALEFSEGCLADGSFFCSGDCHGKAVLSICKCSTGAASFSGTIVGETSAAHYAWDLGALSDCDIAECKLPVKLAYGAGGELDGDGCRLHLFGCGKADWSCDDADATLNVFQVDPLVWLDLLCHGGSACCANVDCYRGDGNNANLRGLIKRKLYATFHTGTGYSSCPIMPTGAIELDYIGVDDAGCPYWESSCLEDIGETKCWHFFGDDAADSTTYFGKIRFYPCCPDDDGGPRLEITCYTDLDCTVVATPTCPPGRFLHWYRPIDGGTGFVTVDLAPMAFNEPCSPTAILRHCVDVTE